MMATGNMYRETHRKEKRIVTETERKRDRQTGRGREMERMR